MAYSKTLKGRYFNIVGHFFSVYCIYKIFMVSCDYLCIDALMLLALLPLHCCIDAAAGFTVC